MSRKFRHPKNLTRDSLDFPDLPPAYNSGTVRFSVLFLEGFSPNKCAVSLRIGTSYPPKIGIVKAVSIRMAKPPRQDLNFLQNLLRVT